MEKRSELCDICQYVKVEAYLYLANYPGTIELGRFQDIGKKDRCPLCQSTTLAQILPLDEPAKHDASKARAIGRAQLVGEKVDISRIRGWIKSCASLHGPNCNPAKPHIIQKPDLSLLLVDVRRMRLAECDWSSRYLALSYVWGSSNGLKSTKANISYLKTDGALRELRGELSQAICDAIDLTDAMGEAYLWVDALCIVQDDSRSRAVFIPHMDQIYGNAHATLVTLNDPPADSAPAGVAHSRILIQSPVEINGLYLVSRLPQLSIVEQFSIWGRRAWTFQERILSRRCLYFAEHQVFWQCRTTYQAEDCPDDHDQDSSDFVRERRSNALERETGNDIARQFDVYESLVKQYSPKALTFSADSLFAFSGILSAMAQSFGWKFASALPESAFDLALLWRPLFGAIMMRPRPLSGQKAEPSVCTSPTWCWTAWSGHIFWDPWRLDSFAAHSVRVKTEVASFWIQDLGGLRQIRRGQVLDSHAEIPGYTASEQTTVNTTLVFEAKTIDIKAYNISAPQTDQCSLWNSKIPGGGLSGYFRNNMSHSLWIYDTASRHCGSLPGFRLDAWSTHCKDSSRYDFVLLSRSSQAEVKQTAIQQFQYHLPLEYRSDREYYEEIFDTRHYKYKNN